MLNPDILTVNLQLPFMSKYAPLHCAGEEIWSAIIIISLWLHTYEWSGADVMMIFTADAATLRPYGAAITVCCVQVQEGNCCMLGPGHIIPGNLASSKLLSQFLHALNFFGNKKQPQHPRPIGILFSLNLMINKFALL